MKKTLVLAAWVMLMAGCSEKTPVEPKAETPGKTVGWRSDGSGHFQNVQAPVTWNEENKKGIVWRAKVGKGQSSPVVAGDCVFVSAEEDLLTCVDRKTGKVLWQKENGFKSLPPEMKVEEKRAPTDPGCGLATPTPVSDGKHVWTTYGTGIVVCYDRDGNRRWVRYIDLPQMTEYGRSASPVLVDGKLIVSIGHVIALDPVTGKTLWDANEVETMYYGTPAAAKIGEVTVLVTPMGDVVRVADGKLLAREIAGLDYNGPIVRNGVVYFGGVVLTALKLPEKTDGPFKVKTLWETELEGEFFSSPVWHDDILYVAGNEGILFALDAVKGTIVWQKEIPIPSASGMTGEAANIYPSLAVADGKLYLANDAGYMLVLVPGREYKEAAQNEIDDGSGASPVFDGKHLFLRGGDKLYCIGPK